jgi:hypothetical protein
MWNNVYRASRDSYERTIDGYDEPDARKTANAAVKGWYRGGRLSSPRGLSRCPDPQPYGRGPAPLNLGLFLELHVVDSKGEVEGRSFAESDKVSLLWSEPLRACFVFPYISPGACARLPTPSEDALARRWARGRPAECVRPVDFPAPAMPTAIPGIAITYYSDKFPDEHGKRTWQRYIHHFGPGVVCYFALSSGKRAPTAIMVRGGRLRLETHGLTG